MSSSWQGSFTKLRAFINEHPDIVVSGTKVSIPENMRSEFYRLFNDTRKAFITWKYPEIIESAETLSQSFTTNQDVVERLLKLKKIIIPDQLKWFIENPVEGLMRILWTPLLDLLKGKTNISLFESNASKEIKQLYDSLYYQAYQDWLELVLIKMLKAKHLLVVNAPSMSGSFSHAQGYVMHLDVKPVILPEESNELLLIRDFTYVSFTVPDFIIYSSELGKYVSVKAEPCKANWIALDPSDSREWLPLDNKLNLFGPGYLLLYVDDNPVNLALVNDVNKICRPDIVLEFREKENWYFSKEMARIKAHRDVLKPRLGTFIASSKPVEESLSQETEEGIHFISVGVDENQLRPIVDALKTL